MRFKFVLQELSQGIKRNLSIYMSVILVSFISLFFIGASILIQFQVVQSKGEWYDKVEVSIYMCPIGRSQSPNCATGIEASQEDTDNVVKFIKTDLKDEISNVVVQSKEDIYKEALKVYPDSKMEGVPFTAEDMQVVIRVKLVNPQHYKLIIESVTGRSGVESVKDQRELFDPVFNTLNGLSIFSITVALTMLIAAILLISTTIRLSSKNREEQIKIMRLSGASNTFIFLPFILEGMTAAFIGSLISIIGLFIFVITIVQGIIAPQNEWIQLIGIREMIWTTPILLLIGLAISSLSSFFTLRKYSEI